jgi:TonB-linked SusC/RagA family outer membrane protein
MRLINIIIKAISCLFICFICENIYAQINLSEKNKSIREIIYKIEKASDYNFFFNNAMPGLEKQTSIHFSNNSIEEVLNNLLKDTDITYNIKEDNQVVLTNLNIPENNEPKTSQQKPTRQIKGTVVDEKGEPVIGANVVEKGTTNGIITDMDGDFSLFVEEHATLHFSYIGYLSQEINISNQNQVQIILKEDSQNLDEVVVIGYGVVKKSDLTGSVSALKSDDINIGMSNSPDQALKGKVAGILITTQSGQPGVGNIVRVRGTSSILGSNDPLYVVDGIPLDGGGSAAGISGKSISPLTTISPSDIESIEILKDASATAIYGSRGANGVIMITTKQGQYGARYNVNANITAGFQQVDHMIELTSPEQWVELWNEAMDYKNSGMGKYDVNNLPARTDWQKAIFRTAPLQRYELNFDGGTDKLRYMLSGSYTTQDGTIMDTDFKRYTLRTNIENKTTNWLTVGANISATRTESNQAEDGGVGANSPVAVIVLATPIKSIYKEDGSYELYADPENGKGNPYASIREITNNDVRNRFASNVYANISFIPDLALKSNFAVDYVNANAYNYIPSYISQGMSPVNGSATIGGRNQLYWNWTNTLTYIKTFNKIHSLTAMAGLEFQKNEVRGHNAKGTNFANDNAMYYNLTEATTYSAGSSYNAWQMESYFARVIYSLMYKYIFTFTGRIDGSSRFGENNKYATFPSGAFAWRIKEEDFMQNLDVLSNLKLRTSYGVSGEQGIPVYRTLSTLTTNNVWMNNTLNTGYYPSRSADPNLKWEKTYQTDIGLDVGLFQNRINLALDYYYKKTTDLHYYQALPPTSGFTSMLKNIGSIENKGFEISLNAYVINAKNFKWDVNINNSWNRNKILELGNDRKEVINPGEGVQGTDVKSTPSILRVGSPLGVLYGYHSDGIIYDETEAAAAAAMGHVMPFPGELKIIDMNEDGKITEEDKDIIANANPKFTGGMTNTFTYKNFELNILLQWIYGNDIMSYQHMMNQRMSSGNNATKEWYDTRWTEKNPSRTEPRAGYDIRAYTDVDYHVFDGSFLRLNNVSLSYSLPKKWLNKINLKTAKISAMVDNLYTFTKYKGWMPDISSVNNVMGQGIDSGTYPVPRTISFSINVGF